MLAPADQKLAGDVVFMGLPVFGSSWAALIPQRVGEPSHVLALGSLSGWWQSPSCLVRYLVR
jgi:hypothetical protein